MVSTEIGAVMRFKKRNETRIEILKEAAKAVCPECREGARFSGSHCLGSGYSQACPATQVHRLIQAELSEAQWLLHLRGEDWRLA